MLQIEGEASPSGEVILTVTEDETPVQGAIVKINGQAVAKTDSNGQVTITLPDTSGNIEIKAILKDKQGVLELVL